VSIKIFKNVKIISVLGARPQFIKAAVVSRAIREYSSVKEVIIHTGQHFDKNMSDIFFDEMSIPKPDYNLQIHGLSHGAMTGRMMEGIEQVIMKENPDMVMVYGDTNSTLAGALAAKKLHVKLAHVEAGLRSFNYKMPEEINRILTDRISDLLFCPTDTAMLNLKKEGFGHFPWKMIKSGDVMQDAALFYSKQSAQHSKIMEQLNLKNKKFVLCTIHRQENTDNEQNLKSIVDALNKISKEIHIVFPIHPRTQQILKKQNLLLQLQMIDPIGYFDIIELLKHCSLVVTDSGGLQKESFFFQKHCVTLREQTEWVELVENGFSLIAGTDENKIYDSFLSLVNKQSDFNVDLYGKGQAGKIIVENLVSNFI
jgi:UDP-GlcNAc3NAcA epimerase